MLEITFYIRIVEFTSDKTLSIEDCVGRIGVIGVLSGITDAERINEVMSRKEITEWAHSRSSSKKETQDGVIR